MLILTRRIGESLMIGDEVTITVLGVKGSQVRVGVNAPKSVGVHREEIYHRIQREKLQKLEAQQANYQQTTDASSMEQQNGINDNIQSDDTSMNE